MEVVNIVQIVTQGGAFALLVVLCLGLYKIVRDVVPALKDFLGNLTASLADLKAKVAVIEVKQDTTNAKIDGVTSAITRTGDATVGALGKLSDVTHEDAAQQSEAIAALERRLAAAIRRELSSDPPAPTSRPSFAATPPTGMQRTSRVGNPQ